MGKKYKKGFSWSELFENSSGKTSGSGTMGIITIFVGLASFIAGVVLIYLSCWKSCETGGGSTILTLATGLVTAGSVLLGVRKATGVEETKMAMQDNDYADESER